jgi:group I intron endonuclease
MILSMIRRKPTSIPGIYLITNTTNGKVYVGQARNINTRWSIHRHHLKHGTHNNRYLQRAWDKAGADAFIFSVALDLSTTTEGAMTEELNFYEALIFAAHKKTYNLLRPGLEGHICGPETLAKLSAASKGAWDRARLNPDLMAARLAPLHAARRTPEARKAFSDTTAALWETPKYREAMMQIAVEKWDRPGYRENHAEKLGEAWSDPVKREIRVAGLVAAWADPQVKARRVEATMAGQAKAMEDPNGKMRKRHEKRWASTDERYRQSKQCATEWADPEIRAKRIAALKAGQARRRAREAEAKKAA